MRKKVAFPPYRTMKPLEWCYAIIFGCLVRSKDGDRWEAWLKDEWSPGELGSVTYWAGSYLKKDYKQWQVRIAKILKNELRHVVDNEWPMRMHAR